jgi:hypothetical protein
VAPVLPKHVYRFSLKLKLRGVHSFRRSSFRRSSIRRTLIPAHFHFGAIVQSGAQVQTGAVHSGALVQTGAVHSGALVQIYFTVFHIRVPPGN